jgi:hypothetical protein
MSQPHRNACLPIDRNITRAFGSRSRCHRRAASTLLEVVLATGIAAGLLVPSLALIRQSAGYVERLVTRERLVAAADRLLAAERLRLASDFVERNAATSTTDVPQGRFQMQTARGRTTAGVSTNLMFVTLTVWQDSNGDGTVTANESVVRMATSVARPW